MASKNMIYVVTMYKFADRCNHSYVLGAYTKPDKAIKDAQKEKEYRGGTKYYPEIIEFMPNDPTNCKTILSEGLTNG